MTDESTDSRELYLLFRRVSIFFVSASFLGFVFAVWLVWPLIQFRVYQTSGGFDRDMAKVADDLDQMRRSIVATQTSMSQATPPLLDDLRVLSKKIAPVAQPSPAPSLPQPQKQPIPDTV